MIQKMPICKVRSKDFQTSQNYQLEWILHFWIMEQIWLSFFLFYLFILSSPKTSYQAIHFTKTNWFLQNIPLTNMKSTSNKSTHNKKPFTLHCSICSSKSTYRKCTYPNYHTFPNYSSRVKPQRGTTYTSGIC